jgi:hypothetical protein
LEELRKEISMIPIENRRDVITLVGLFLTIPGFVFYFLSGERVIGILTLLLVAVFLVAVWQANQPPFTVIEYGKTLTLKDQAASEAHQVSELRLRANHKGVRMIHLATVSADGSVQDIKVNDMPPTYQRRRAGEIEIRQDLPRPLGWWQEEKLAWSVKYRNSFRKDTEGYTHVVGHKTKDLRITVNFYQGKPCKRVRGFLRYGGQIWRAHPVELSEDKLRAKLRKKRPKLGSEYRIEWDW